MDKAKQQIRKMMTQMKVALLHYNDMAVIQSIRRGLLYQIPFLVIGSFAGILLCFPNQSYQDFIHLFWGARIFHILYAIQFSTFGCLSLYTAFTISMCYAQTRCLKVTYTYGASFAVIMCLVFSIAFTLDGGFNISLFGLDGMLYAILLSCLLAPLYTLFAQIFKPKIKIYSDGVDSEFNAMFFIVSPTLLTIISYILANIVFHLVFGKYCYDFVSSIIAFLTNRTQHPIFASFFQGVFSSFGQAGLSIYQSSFGTKVVNLTSSSLSSSFLMQETCKLFSDIGGRGNVLCLLFAMMIAGKNKTTKKLALLCLAPCIFGVAELAIFAIPVVYNPTLFLPFVFVPVMSEGVARLFIHTGLIPQITKVVSPIMPIGLSAGLATDSFSCVFLQLLVFVLGVLIYCPFVVLWQKSRIIDVKKTYEILLEALKRAEQERLPTLLTKLRSEQGHLARVLQYDLMNLTRSSGIEMWYQPQVDLLGKIIGVEALFRWRHPDLGYIYPPLALRLAKEGEFLGVIDRQVFNKVGQDYESLCHILPEGCKISVNVTGWTLRDPTFVDFLESIRKKYNFTDTHPIWVEITEQNTTGLEPDAFSRRLKQIRQLGYKLALDDFCMGFSSMNYLKTGCFDLVKLDGSLITGMEKNAQTQEIISSIVQLSKTMNFSVLAEFVEKEEQQKKLEEIGCTQYQGYLYSQAVKLGELKVDFSKKQSSQK